MFWKRGVGLVLLFFLGQIATAKDYAFRLTFRDKQGAATLSEASTFLSPRSLERRRLQGLQTDSTDRPLSPVYLKKIVELSGGTLLVQSRWLNTCVLVLADSQSILSLKEVGFISSIEFIAYRKITSPALLKTTANPGYYGSSWSQTQMIHGECLHDQGWLGKGKLIAVLDNGFHYVNSAPAFDSLYQSGRIVDTWNFLTTQQDVYTAYLLHGTEVLSTMAANVPNTYIGAAPQASYALYVTEESGTETPLEMDYMVAAFERADSMGADIISSSLGYNDFDSPFGSIPPAQMDGKTTVAAIGANLAVQKGMLLVMTMGNEGSHGILTPGDADSVITVGSVGTNGQPAGSSGYGPNAAGITKPDVCALGSPASVMTDNLSPFSVSGTSVATPQIAGFAACLWQGYPAKNNFEIKQAILHSAPFFSNPQLPQLGYGIANFCEAIVRLDVSEPEALKGHRTISAVPNPTDGPFELKVFCKKREQLHLTLFTITGEVVLKRTTFAIAGINTLPVSLPPSSSPGVYFCRIQSDEATQTVRIIKK